MSSFTKTDGSWVKDTNSAWTTDGSTVGSTQEQDRPGESKISAALDADNNYGYDSAYETMSTHSLGSGAKINVNENKYATAEFTFYGTGFDVISLTSNGTGTITVLVKDADGNTVRNTVVDTYYGMEEDGTLSVNNPNTIYQVPVIKIFDLEYGKYTVKITAAYNKVFDHNSADSDSYDLYLDAIRIYDPTGNLNETANEAYVADGEAYPIYEELRDNIIAASEFTVTENGDGTVTVTVADGSENLSGSIFIDCNDTASIADYVSYGPNNELYLAKNQAIAFNVNVPENVADVQLGIKMANGSTVTYEINGISYTVETATDMYYSILEYAKAGTVTIKNVSDGILSLTNIKVTHTSAPATEAGISLLSMDAESAGVALMSLRPAVEEEVPEITVPEETEPEEELPETTEPEQTETEEDNIEEEIIKEVVKTVKEFVKKLFGWLFG